jgi:precorrin-6x reductase
MIAVLVLGGTEELNAVSAALTGSSETNISETQDNRNNFMRRE